MNLPKKTLLIALGFFAVIPLVLPLLASAAVKPNLNVWDPRIIAGPLVLCQGGPLNPADGSPNTNACENFSDLIYSAVNLIYFVIGLVLWVIAPILFVFSGGMMLFAGANPEMISSGRKTLTGTAIGVAIVIS